jgi:ParB family transcriptional regulator, chromosome partitioning protein
MYRDLARLDGASKETDYALELEEPAFATLGFAYEQRGRLSGGAYQPILKKVDAFLELPLAEAMAERERRAGVVLAFDDAVSEAVAKLKERGFDSPYLKAFVVARVNPLRFMKGDAPPPSTGSRAGFDELFAQMTKRAQGLDASKVKGEDVARSGGAPEAEG